ncbi:hypothetical protein ACFS07_31820 [Undibacterium arcticum]
MRNNRADQKAMPHASSLVLLAGYCQVTNCFKYTQLELIDPNWNSDQARRNFYENPMPAPWHCDAIATQWRRK